MKILQKKKWHFSLDERRREMSSFSEILCWYPWGYIPYMDSRVLAGTWVYKDLSVVIRYSWFWLATILDVSFHHLTLFYISFCWPCYGICQDCLPHTCVCCQLFERKEQKFPDFGAMEILGWGLLGRQRELLTSLSGSSKLSPAICARLL